MTYQQLVQPNLSVAGEPDYCLAYVQSVFNVPASNPHDPDAWQGWLDTQFKHQDRNLPSVAVPIWCAWSGTVEGVYSNYGHVAVWTGTEVYTNPLSGSGHKVFPSIEAMETAYGVQFVGWSEDIETLRVIKEIDMPTPLKLDTGRMVLFGIAGLDGEGLGGTRKNAATGEADAIIQGYIDKGYTLEQFIVEYWNSQQGDDFRNKEIPAVYDLARQAKVTPTTLSPGLYDVK